MFTADQKESLRAPLSSANVKTRSQAGRSLSYIESWKAIEEANFIFGFDGWTSETVDVKCVAERERQIGREPNTKPGWGVSYTARVRVRVGDVTRDGVGAGHGIDVDLGQAHESAIKEAESDARKRALMTFGYRFGLALYDKQQEHVTNGTEPKTEPKQERGADGLLSMPNAIQVAGDLIAELQGCVTSAEIEQWRKHDQTKRRYASLPQKFKDQVSQAIRQRMDKLGDKAA